MSLPILSPLTSTVRREPPPPLPPLTTQLPKIEQNGKSNKYTLLPTRQIFSSGTF